MKNKIISILKCIGIILLVMLFSSFFFVFLNINLDNISDKTYIIYLSISNLILLCIMGYIYRGALINDGKKFFKNFNKNIDISFKYWLVGFAIMIVSNLIINIIVGMEISDNEELVRSYIDISPLLMIFDSVIYAPIVEELAFRKSIREAIKNKWFYVIVSGVIFGLMHIIGSIDSASDLLYLIPYSSLGISFALLYYKTDNIYSSISMHAFHNLLSVIIYLLGVYS